MRSFSHGHVALCLTLLSFLPSYCSFIMSIFPSLTVFNFLILLASITEEINALKNQIPEVRPDAESFPVLEKVNSLLSPSSTLQISLFYFLQIFSVLSHISPLPLYSLPFSYPPLVFSSSPSTSPLTPTRRILVRAWDPLWRHSRPSDTPAAPLWTMSETVYEHVRTHDWT